MKTREQRMKEKIAKLKKTRNLRTMGEELKGPTQ